MTDGQTDVTHSVPAPPAQLPLDPFLRFRSWWLKHLPSRDDLYRQRVASRSLRYRPVFSIITPVHDTPPDLLDRMLQSVANQTYPYWEHCLVDDGSTAGWLSGYLDRLSRREPRVRFKRRDHNGGIVNASNDALDLATGEFVVMLDHDDELDVQALFSVATRLNGNPDTDVFYSDFDSINRQGRRFQGYMLPDWSPDLLLIMPLITHLSAFRRSLVEHVGRFRPDYEGSQDYDLALRIVSVTDKVVHIPEVLYHWRMWERSVAANPTAKPYAYEAGRRAVEDHLRRNNVAGRREDAPWLGFHIIRYDILGTPTISVVACAPPHADADQRRTFALALQDLVARGGYGRCEIVLVVSAEEKSAWEETSNGTHPIRLVACENTDIAIRLNAGASAAGGDHLAFLPRLVSAEADGWLKALLEQSQREAIGAVGSRLVTEDGTLWHVGMVVPRGVPHPVRYEPMLGNFSAVSGIGMMTGRATFEKAGRFRPAAEVGHPDFDYCLRLREAGLRHVVTSCSRLRILGSIDMTIRAEARFVELWRDAMRSDPYYNPNFRQDTGDFTLALD